ncbi:hypothetical protein ACFB49_06090 [Sphingomonas sp. DBB INV C78]
MSSKPKTKSRRSSSTGRTATSAAPAKAANKRLGFATGIVEAARSRAAAVIGVAAAGLVTGLALNFGRKAVAQASTVMAGDWLEALKAEHKVAIALFDDLEQTSDDDPARRAHLLAQLRYALGKHAFTEENVIYPALRAWGDKADADKLNHDHGYTKQHLYELEALDKAASGFAAKAAHFRADLEAHVREEEDMIFPQLHAALDEAANARLTALANKEAFTLA